MTATSTPGDPGRARKDFAYLFLTFGLVIAVGAAFFQPWTAPPAPGGPDLNRYLPIVNGDARLYGLQDAAGQAVGWESHNLSTPSVIYAMAHQLRPAISIAVLARYSRGLPSPNQILDRVIEDFGAVRLAILRRRLLRADGQIEPADLFYVRDETGHYLVGLYNEQADTELVFDPLLQLYPRELALGSRWSSQGKVNGQFDYAYEGEVVAQAARETALGQFDDCLQIQTRYTLNIDPPVDEREIEWVCASAGVVERERRDASGALIRRSLPLTSAASLPPPRLLDRNPPLADPDRWRLSAVGKANLSGVELESTVRPTWLPLDPPLVLVAAYNGDLLAFRADGEATGQLAWRFRTGGTIFGQPTFDPLRGRIYFGASDKRLYALDGRGLFLWSFLTGDNVATRPLAIRDTVIFGSEDGSVYALDADTGALRWRAAAGAAVASSPAQVDNQHVIVGTDDGQVLAYAIEDGELQWAFEADGPVEADVVIADGMALVATSTGNLVALNAQTGEEVWRYSVGGGIRHPPAVGDDLAVVLSHPGRLTALSLADGRRLWNSTARRYSGAPAIVGEYVLVTDTDGQFHLSDRQGRRLLSWATRAQITPDEVSNRYDFTYGPEIGGGAIWAINAKTVLWRLGP